MSLLAPEAITSLRLEVQRLLEAGLTQDEVRYRLERLGLPAEDIEDLSPSPSVIPPRDTPPQDVFELLEDVANFMERALPQLQAFAVNSHQQALSDMIIFEKRCRERIQQEREAANGPSQTTGQYQVQHGS